MIGIAGRKPNAEPYIATNGVAWQTIADYREAALASLADLEPVRDHGALADDVIPLAAVVRNERSLIEGFLDHYRFLGVKRFMIVDNGSSDGTSEVLSSASDVDLWRTDRPFSAANQGRLWIDGLLWQRARERWVLHVDIDEFLVFAGMEKDSLSKLISWLEFRNANRMLAPMLDVYSDRPIRETVIRPGDDPLKICNWFDHEPEVIHDGLSGTWITGGARRRLFFPDEPEMRPGLSKFPLLRYDIDTTFINCHMPSPYEENHLVPYGRLLHVKIHADLAFRAVKAIGEKQYWRNATEYEQYTNIIANDKNFNPFYSKSRRYENPMTLVECGFMRDARISTLDHAKRFARWILHFFWRGRHKQRF